MGGALTKSNKNKWAYDTVSENEVQIAPMDQVPEEEVEVIFNLDAEDDISSDQTEEVPILSNSQNHVPEEEVEAVFDFDDEDDISLDQTEEVPILSNSQNHVPEEEVEAVFDFHAEDNTFLDEAEENHVPEEEVEAVFDFHAEDDTFLDEAEEFHAEEDTFLDETEEVIHLSNQQLENVSDTSSVRTKTLPLLSNEQSAYNTASESSHSDKSKKTMPLLTRFTYLPLSEDDLRRNIFHKKDRYSGGSELDSAYNTASESSYSDKSKKPMPLLSRFSYLPLSEDDLNRNIFHKKDRYSGASEVDRMPLLTRFSYLPLSEDDLRRDIFHKKDQYSGGSEVDSAYHTASESSYSDKSKKSDSYTFTESISSRSGDDQQSKLPTIPESFYSESRKKIQSVYYTIPDSFYSESTPKAKTKHHLNVGAGRVKPKRKIPNIADFVYMDERIEEKTCLVLADTNYLPRYKYHRYLLDWCMEGMSHIPSFQEYHFDDCSIIVGGNMNEENKIQLFGQTTIIDKVAVTDLQKEKNITEHTDILMVYIFTGDIAAIHTEIIKLRNVQVVENGQILFVITVDAFNDEQLKSRLHTEFTTYGFIHIEFVLGTRSEIINRLTLMLEKRVSDYLEQIQTKLLECACPTYTTRTSLSEVNSILRRLKQASCYPEPLSEDDDEKANHKEIYEIIDRFGDRILYDELDETILYITTTDQDVKDTLEAWYSVSDQNDLQLIITVEDKLSISELSKTGVPLHGAKLVYVDEDVESYHVDQCFATTGSLMLANNNNLMLAITCRHALEQVDTCFTLIDNVVVKLGQEMPQPNNRMERLCDDIAVVAIDDDTRSVVDEKCEKLLIDSFGFPSPAQISFRDLKVGDIVHKRGAKTGLTTGIVKSIRNQTIGRFRLPSKVIYIASRDATTFAMEGDSGSLVFQPSLSPEEIVLEVLAMVQGKIVQNSQTRVVCLPFKESCDNLKQNIPDLQNLQFFNS